LEFLIDTKILEGRYPEDRERIITFFLVEFFKSDAVFGVRSHRFVSDEAEYPITMMKNQKMSDFSPIKGKKCALGTSRLHSARKNVQPTDYSPI
jgi:hypothetical protein